MSETQKIKRLRSTITASFAPLYRVTSKFDQPSLLRMQLQAKLCKAILKVLQAHFRVGVTDDPRGDFGFGGAENRPS